MTLAAAPPPPPRHRWRGGLVATLGQRAEWVRRGLWLAGGSMLLWATYEALTPRPDWYAPIAVFPLRLRSTGTGSWTTDKLGHFGFGLALALVLLAALGRAPHPHSERLLLSGLVCWMIAIELTQAFLPYRNAELLDCGGGLLGLMLGLLAARIVRARVSRRAESRSAAP